MHTKLKTFLADFWQILYDIFPYKKVAQSVHISPYMFLLGLHQYFQFVFLAIGNKTTVNIHATAKIMNIIFKSNSPITGPFNFAQTNSMRLIKSPF